MSKYIKIIKYGAISIIAILLLVLISTFNPKTKNYASVINIESNQKQEVTKTSPLTNDSYTVRDGTPTFLEVGEIKYETKLKEDSSVYDFMNLLRIEGKIAFKEKTYSGIGKFIEEINSLKSNGSNFWIYYVNGVEANIGVSNYKINPGDVVSWKYEKNKY